MKLKNILIVIGFIAFFLCQKQIAAQGNLQFNRAIYMELTLTQVSSTVYAETTQSITVPANKVWKIDAASANYNILSNSTTSSVGYVLINGRTLSSATAGVSYLPVWLPAGTYTISLKSGSLSSSVVFNSYISGIEFNVVP